jgi:hypothetical protein
MHLVTHWHRLRPREQLILAVVLLALAAVFIFLHGLRIQQMRETGLPAALALPQVEKRIAVLQAQDDVMQLQQSVGGGSALEQLHTQVLPAEGGLDRLLSAFDALFDTLKKQHMLLRVSALHVGQTQGTVTPVTFETDVNEEGLRELLLFCDLAGLMTVSDALTAQEQQLLLQLTEDENPAAVTALEAFLGTDLLTYARDPRGVTQQLLKSFSSENFEQTVLSITQQSHLQEATRLLGGSLQDVFAANKLWPVRFLTVSHVDIVDRENGTFHVSLELQAHGRTK